MRKKDSAPAIDDDLQNYLDDEEKNEEGYMNDDASSAVNMRKVVPSKLKWQAQNYHSTIN